MYKYKFTIFTPVYNRKNSITRVWKSLNNQTYKNFEWIIVDDGSNDNILPLLNKFKKEAFFPVTIITQQNQGKHIAWNKAIKIAKGYFFLPADSDDEFIPKTLETFLFYWNNITKKENPNLFSGINCLCKNPSTGKIIGDKFPHSPFISNNLELFYKYKIKGEKWGFIRTDILKTIPFPEIPGKGCYPLTFLWHSIARNYQNISINKALRLYYEDTKNAITKNNKKNKLRNVEMKLDFFIWDLNNNLDYKIKYFFFENIAKEYIYTWIYSKHLKLNIYKIFSKFNTFSKILAALFLIPSFFLYYTKFKKNRL